MFFVGLMVDTLAACGSNTKTEATLVKTANDLVIVGLIADTPAGRLQE